MVHRGFVAEHPVLALASRFCCCAQAGAADWHVKFQASSRKSAFSLDTKNASFESLSLPECA